MKSEPRSTVFPAIIPTGIFLGTALAILLLPIWRCASCDRATWKRVYPNCVIQVWRDSPAECEFCLKTGRMSLVQRWDYLQVLKKCGFRPGYPLIP